MKYNLNNCASLLLLRLLLIYSPLLDSDFEWKNSQCTLNMSLFCFVSKHFVKKSYVRYATVNNI